MCRRDQGHSRSPTVDLHEIGGDPSAPMLDSVLHRSVLPVASGVVADSRTTTSADFSDRSLASRYGPTDRTATVDRKRACPIRSAARKAAVPPWIRRMTFAAQALDLPERLNDDGFAMIGSLT